ncbi:MAG: L-lactate permease, partial [Nitriliruptoraceae bacterium]
ALSLGGLSENWILAGQTAGGNVGNALTPAVAAVGTSAAGASGRESEVIRRNLLGAGILLVVILLGLLVQLALVSG